jgi:hypothetical protein
MVIDAFKAIELGCWAIAALCLIAVIYFCLVKGA